MGAPAATVIQKIGFQGFLSVVLDAVQPPLSLRVLSSSHSSGLQIAHKAPAVPGGWAQSLWRLGMRTSKRGISRAGTPSALL